MNVSTILRLTVACVCLSAYQEPVAQTLSAADKTAAIQSIAAAIAANYVDPEKGGQISSFIQTANFKGVFNKAETWKEFDSLVTIALYKASNDHHLYVRNDPQVVRELRNQSNKNDDQNNIKESEKNARKNNYGFKKSVVLEGNIGYLELDHINITKASLHVLQSAMEKLQNTRAMIIDLRDNGGGGSEVGPVLESYFLPGSAPLLEFRSRDGSIRTDSTLKDFDGKKYEKPVYIIVNKKTASAAEAFAFVMKQNKRAVIVGERSAGAAFMNDWFSVNDDNFVSVSTAAPTLPGKGLSWEGDGIQPDIKIKNEDPIKKLLSTIP